MRNCAGFFFHLTPLSHVCYNYHTMSDQPAVSIVAVPHHISKHRIVEHRVTVEGWYTARPYVRHAAGGAAERRRVEYRESFVLPGGPAHHAHAHGAMASVLAKLLPERLEMRDKEFRGILTHTVGAYTTVVENDEQRDARVKAWVDAQPKPAPAKDEAAK